MYDIFYYEPVHVKVCVMVRTCTSILDAFADLRNFYSDVEENIGDIVNLTSNVSRMTSHVFSRHYACMYRISILYHVTCTMIIIKYNVLCMYKICCCYDVINRSIVCFNSVARLN